ncbi:MULTISPECIES: (2Fe-2S)-binding protein [unclassified Beijerinckia]|uniref:(2Fe-2S)-binding protein n=1 Tax=unclassified Beijerinckia TaxID=2638183 RepID=UPI0008957BC4|nr:MULTISPECIES: (2Fe-2S)-binding protein [unclassified Beijerinckia]MDH7798808.1 carbon-monoxide dehydrogenase small subunit [Beijerinckia sp. GAS462]SED33968.1 carbon-monoxide dehydrogenase small subunit [Beijerinckia sp. 28-YEA-48]
MTDMHTITFTLNGRSITAEVDARLHLADFLRHTLRLTGTHIGCEHGVCGACNVLIDGLSTRSCLTLAVQADGAQIETIEGLTASGKIADLQEAFAARNALQCGYCTPGVLATAAELLNHGTPTRGEIRDALSGNYCRCTGYHAIVDAIESVAEKRRGQTS